ncbi:hypothetical protein TrispH2_003151 [Trichoplax sp. H2]|nr:hypothetical protein TrispH2_003151 [Trichoplax sp. H2]|eukprot:RDD44953.1 hypothetical protein TrispH2_003151 [Trichoplax sp. H2]
MNNMAEDYRYKEPPKIARLNKDVKAELYTPMVLPNHQRGFKWLTYTTVVGLGIYLVLYHDYGYEDHCFSWIRQKVSSAKETMLQLDPADEKELKKISSDRTK